MEKASATANLVWSFSSLKTFQQCPRKYYHVKVVKDIVDTPHVSALYGSAVHKAAEDYVRDNTEVPQKYGYIKPVLEALKKIPGKKFCELELGLTKTLEPCKFDAPDVWWHGIIDLLVVNDGVAHMLDYKTSKSSRYADIKQLDYMAVGVFAHFPAVQKIKSALLFVVSNEIVRKDHYVEDKKDYIATAMPDVARIEAAKNTGVWNPVSGPLCKFCPVRSCEHNRG